MNIRKDIFTTTTPTRMSDTALVTLLKRKDVGMARKAMTLAHQSRAAMLDGDVEAAAYIEGLSAQLHRV